MAYRKKSHKTKKQHKKSSRRRPRRMGALALNPHNDMVKIGAAALGFFVLAKPLNDLLDKATGGKIDSKIVAGGQLALGAFLVFKKKPNLVTTVIGGVLAGAGLKRGLVDFGVITGYGAVPVIGGYQRVPVIAGYTPNGTLGSYTTAKKNAIVGAMDNGRGSGLMRND